LDGSALSYYGLSVPWVNGCLGLAWLLVSFFALACHFLLIILVAAALFVFCCSLQHLIILGLKPLINGPPEVLWAQIGWWLLGSW